MESTAKDGRERDQWLRHSKRTVDFAHQVKARNIVLHLGSVEFFWFNPAKLPAPALDKRPTVFLFLA